MNLGLVPGAGATGIPSRIHLWIAAVPTCKPSSSRSWAIRRAWVRKVGGIWMSVVVVANLGIGDDGNSFPNLLAVEEKEERLLLRRTS